MNIVVASKNPVKLEAAREAFLRMFPDVIPNIKQTSVPSGVSDQPSSDAETYQGALNRITAARTEHPDADYWIAFESGIELKGEEMEAFAWAVVGDRDGRLGKGRSTTFFLPPEVAQLVRDGKELGEADDIVFNRNGAKRENGIVGILTDNAVTRTRYHADAAVFALIPFKNPDLYPQ